MALCFSRKEIKLPLYENNGTGTGYSQQIFEWGMRAVQIELDVANAPVVMSLLSSATGESSHADWEQDLYVSPQHRTISRQGIFGIRFKTIEPEGELPFVSFEVIGEAEAYPNFAQLLK